VSAADYYTVAAIAELVLPSDLYTVVGVQQTQEIAGESLIDYLDISYIVTGRVGVFSVQLPLVGFRVFESGIDLTSEANIVNALYGIAV
jgi:hypothetical protein